MHPAKLIGILWTSVALAALSGCDSRKIAELEEGVSTEADVRARFGEPGMVFTERNDARTLEYSRQPEGYTNYFITIEADGKMSMLRQVLTPANFAKIVPGQTAPQVRRALGQPARTRSFAARGEEVWEWRFLQDQESKLFTVTFGKDGQVRSTATEADAKQFAG